MLLIFSDGLGGESKAMLEDQSDRLRKAGKFEIENVHDEARNVQNNSLLTQVLWPLVVDAAGAQPPLTSCTLIH